MVFNEYQIDAALTRFFMRLTSFSVSFLLAVLVYQIGYTIYEKPMDGKSRMSIELVALSMADSRVPNQMSIHPTIRTTVLRPITDFLVLNF